MLHVHHYNNNSKNIILRCAQYFKCSFIGLFKLGDKERCRNKLSKKYKEKRNKYDWTIIKHSRSKRNNDIKIPRFFG